MCLSVLMFLTPAVAGAQEKPDLTGQWVLVSAADAENGAARALSVRLFFEHEKDIRGEPIDVPYVTISKMFQSETNSTAQSTTYRIGADGGLAGGRSVPGPSTRFAVRWDSDRLLIETGSYTISGSYSERDEEWTIDESGQLTMTINVRASGDAPTTTTFKYRRP
jgi:hypothetical protein